MHFYPSFPLRGTSGTAVLVANTTQLSRYAAFSSPSLCYRGCKLCQISCSSYEHFCFYCPSQWGLIWELFLTYYSQKNSNSNMLTGRSLKASGRIEERALQVLVWSVGCWEFWSAPGNGPFSILAQNVTTYKADKILIAISKTFGFCEWRQTGAIIT